MDWDVDWGLILGKSGEAAKAKSYFKASPARPAPHTPLSRARLQWPGAWANHGGFCSESRGKSWLQNIHTQ